MKNSPSKQEAYDKIAELVEQFASQIEVFKKTQNETETRNQFINPFFDALGWDTNNTKRRAIDSDRDVVHEDRVTIEGKSKAPDYSFRVDGKRKFFLEAKKPSIQIETDIVPSYQLRRYGWNDPEVHISILTDFEEFAIYDCTIQPKQTDPAKLARIEYITYDQYLEKFDALWDLFSKEQVLKGSLDRFAKTVKKGTLSVDSAFLQSLDEWRNYLATSIALRNKHLNEEEINYLVQMNINRIVFIRNCEDRGAEPYGKLKGCLVNSNDEGGYFRNMYQVFEDADRKYNSGLFDFTKDTLSKSVIIDNEVIKNIVDELYFPKSPYEFSVIGVEILGTAYERFLGKVIRLTPDHQAIVEEKPEVRKAGGVFYTPQYIVEYIVKNTVGKLVEGKPPDEIKKIKICDPACGSGSFLLGAYQYLLVYHTDWYIKNYKKSRNLKDSPLTPDGRLTTHVKKQILLNNIFGVDIDTQAVEVTKLSLLMKCMEGETTASMQTTMTFERVLPTLENNIKSGNSLIDFDFYEGQLDFGEDKKIKPFNWKSKFPEVFKQGGFDCIIGNPPYVAIDGISHIERTYYNIKYPLLKKRLDLFGLFVDKGLKVLNSQGKLSFIIPMQFLRNSAFEDLRKNILEAFHFEEINSVGNKVFEDANNDTIIIVISKSNKIRINTKLIESNTTKTNLFTVKETSISQKTFLLNRENIINLSSEETKDLFNRIEKQSLKIANRFKVIQGIVTGLNCAYIYNKKDTPKIEKELLKDFIFGSDFDRFSLRNPEHHIIYVTKKIDLKLFPDAERVISPCKIQLEKRREVQRNLIPWYSLQWPREQATFEIPKILFQKIRNQKLKQRLVGTYDESGLFVGDGVIYINSLKNDKGELKFLLAILNSKLYNYYYREQFLDINLKIKYLENTSVIDYIKFKGDSLKLYNETISLVDKLLQLNTEKWEVNLQGNLDHLQNRIDYAEQRINEIVYELYELTPEEIQIIESQS